MQSVVIAGILMTVDFLLQHSAAGLRRYQRQRAHEARWHSRPLSEINYVVKHSSTFVKAMALFQLQQEHDSRDERALDKTNSTREKHV
jgi:hypothetical protein